VAQIFVKGTYTCMKKQLLIIKLIEMSCLINKKNADPSDSEPTNHFEDVVLYQALRMLTNKQINKLIEKQKNLI
jgi:hypothetical protein